MNIQISKTLLNKETIGEFFLPRSFFQSQNRLFFIADYVSETHFSPSTDQVSFYSAIELKDEGDTFTLSDDVIILKVDNETEELLETLFITSIPEGTDRDSVWIETFEWLFIVLRNEKGENNATYSKDILPVLYKALKHYPYKTSAFHSGKEIEVCVLENFKITAEATTGYYEGNVLMRNWKVVEHYSGQIVAELEDLALTGQLFIEEDDSEDDLLEALVESMSRYDIISLASEALQKSIKQEDFQNENKKKMDKKNEGSSS